MKLQCLVEEIYGVILNLTTLSTDDSTYRRGLSGRGRGGSAGRRREKESYLAFLKSPNWLTYTINLASNFSVGVPEITEDQFFDDFSCINQIQAKKRGQINKEVSVLVINFRCKFRSQIHPLIRINVEWVEISEPKF